MINLFLGVFQPNRTIVDINGQNEMPPIQAFQDHPTLELALHQHNAITKRQGFSSDVDVESRYWWEKHFMVFEERLPTALRYTYQNFDVVAAVPRSLDDPDTPTILRKTSNDTFDNSSRMYEKDMSIMTTRARKLIHTAANNQILPTETERTSEGSVSMTTYENSPLNEPMRLLLNQNVGLQQITEESSLYDIPGSAEN